ncbi:hypothetical protein FA13DRAFT_1812098 [Coprinellus micaceus]|uniref:Uncharacterized protein n=1 Tax=Coprinellus micaceus TaxID=71717 RepID=A0A4Y7TIX5_COPMI|nr:hypothetical protein FA13DRAFT_1812098 [Coprinellus micaceus]
MTITQNSASGIRRPSTKSPGCSGSCQIELKNKVLELQDKIHRLCREFITENGLDFEIDSEEEDKQGHDKNYPHDGRNPATERGTHSHSHIARPQRELHVAQDLTYILDPTTSPRTGHPPPKEEQQRHPVFKAPSQRQGDGTSSANPEPATPAGHGRLKKVYGDTETDGEEDEVEDWYGQHKPTPTLLTNGNGSPISRRAGRSSATQGLLPLFSYPSTPLVGPRNRNSVSGRASLPLNANRNQPNVSPDCFRGPGSTPYIPAVLPPRRADSESPLGYVGSNSPRYIPESPPGPAVASPDYRAMRLANYGIGIENPPSDTHHNVRSLTGRSHPPPQSASHARNQTDIHGFRDAPADTSPFFPDDDQRPTNQGGPSLRENANAQVAHQPAASASPEKALGETSPNGAIPSESQFQHPSSSPSVPAGQDRSSAYPSPQEAHVAPTAGGNRANKKLKRQRLESSDDEPEAREKATWPNPTTAKVTGAFFKFGGEEGSPLRKKKKVDAQPAPTHRRRAGIVRQPTPGPSRPALSRQAPPRQGVRSSSRLQKRETDGKGKGKAKASDP